MFKSIDFKVLPVFILFGFSNIFCIEVSDLRTLAVRDSFLYFLQTCPGCNAQIMEEDLIGRYLEPQLCRYCSKYSCVLHYLLSKNVAELSSNASEEDKIKCFQVSIWKATFFKRILRDFLAHLNDYILKAIKSVAPFDSYGLEKEIDHQILNFCAGPKFDYNIRFMAPTIYEIFNVFSIPRHYCDFFCNIWIDSTSIYRLLKHFDQSLSRGFLTCFQEEVLNYFFSILTFCGQSISLSERSIALDTMLFFTYNWKIRDFDNLYAVCSKRDEQGFKPCQSSTICPLKLVYCLELAKMFNRKNLEFEGPVDSLIEKLLIGSNCSPEEFLTYKIEFFEKLTGYLRNKAKNPQETNLGDFLIRHPDVKKFPVFSPKKEESIFETPLKQMSSIATASPSPKKSPAARRLCLETASPKSAS